MITSNIIVLLNNVALLMALGLVYHVLAVKQVWGKAHLSQISTGVILGIICVTVMLNPWQFAPGIIFDTRSIVLCIAGFFFGAVPTLLAVLITGGYRILLGGSGAWTGVMVIAASGIIGLIWRYKRNAMKDVSMGELYALGMVVHVSMLLCMLTLPWAVAMDVLSKISFPVILIFPAVTAVLGKLMVERKKREKAAYLLAKEEKKFRLLFQNLTSGFALHEIILNEQGNPIDYRFLDVNPAFERLTGLKAEDIVGRTVLECMPDTEPRWIETYGKVATTGNSVQFEDYSRELDRHYSVTAYALERGKFVTIFNDVTDRKQAEEALHESVQKYRLLADNTLDVIWTMNLDLEFTYVNQAVLSLAGYLPDEWIGSRLMEYCDEGNFARMARFVQDELERGPDSAGVVFEAFVLNKNGESIPVEIHGKVIFDENSEPVLFQGTTRDISKRKEEERKREHLEEQLFQAQKMEAVGRLAGGVAHDFNNMLSVIIGCVEILMESAEQGNDSHELLSEVLEAGNRAKDLTRQLLVFSRKQMLEVRSLDINNVIVGFEKMLRRMIGEDIVLKLSLSPSPIQVDADVSQLEQVLLNMAVNARDAMAEGGIISIETKEVDLDEESLSGRQWVKKGRYAMIGFSDTGIGMDRETAGKIFEPFFTTKGREEGTGLGLATSYGIIKQHGGNIWVYSEPGQGSTFKIYLPVSSKNISEEKQIDKVTVAHAATGTILVVEDDQAVRKLVCKILKGKGYKVIDSESVYEAIELAGNRDEPIDLLLTDVVMPGMKGPQVYEKIVESHPDIGVLYMSGYTDDIIGRHGVLEQGVQFIQKPFSANGLIDKINEVLTQK